MRWKWINVVRYEDKKKPVSLFSINLPLTASEQMKRASAWRCLSIGWKRGRGDAFICDRCRVQLVSNLHLRNNLHAYDLRPIFPASLCSCRACCTQQLSLKVLFAPREIIRTCLLHASDKTLRHALFVPEVVIDCFTPCQQLIEALFNYHPACPRRGN